MFKKIEYNQKEFLEKTPKKNYEKVIVKPDSFYDYNFKKTNINNNDNFNNYKKFKNNNKIFLKNPQSKRLNKNRKLSYSISNCNNKVYYIDQLKKEFEENHFDNLNIKKGCDICNKIYKCKCCGKIKHMNIIFYKN